MGITLGTPSVVEERPRTASHVGIDAASGVFSGGEFDRDHLEWLRSYVGRPWAYISDRLRLSLTAQQEEALELMEENDRLLIPSGNALGKTFILAGYGLYVFEVMASVRDDEMHRERQGARVLLPGPDAATVFATVYSEMLVQSERSEKFGPPLPGIRSERSVHWYVPKEPMWAMEAFSPPRRVTETVRHTAAGRHHSNMVALIEEGQGVDEPTWKGVEGMCVSSGNKIISSFNPTEPKGPTFQRASRGDYKVLHLDAFDHPNVERRSYVVPAAIDFKVIDSRVGVCDDLGPYPHVTPDPEHNDFIYALPEAGWAEKGPRDDGFRGHPDADLHVFRPDFDFQARVRGQYPSELESGLFSPAHWDEAVNRWKRGNPRPTNLIGLDVAREGGDTTVGARKSGPDPDKLLRSYIKARKDGNVKRMRQLEAKKRIRIEMLDTFPRGTGPQVARQVLKRFGSVPMNVDESGVGASVHDHLKEVLGVDSIGIAFGGAAPAPLHGEHLGDNLRAAMYIRAAYLITLGLVDVPDDPMLREELMATDFVIVDKTIRTEQRDGTVKIERKAAIRLIAKEKIKKSVGRSPDRADAFVLALHSPRRMKRRRPRRSTEFRL